MEQISRLFKEKEAIRRRISEINSLSDMSRIGFVFFENVILKKVRVIIELPQVIFFDMISSILSNQR